MRPKSMVLILIALGCGLIASIGISQVVERNSGETEQVETQPIFVAMSDIGIGDELTAQNVKMEEWPIDKIPEGAIIEATQLEGQSPKQRLFAGEPLLMGKLVDRESLRKSSQTIPKGYRVTSVKVDMASSVSYLITPGDRVDVLSLSGPGNSAEVILSDIEVFAINTHTSREVDADGGTVQAKTVSLLVTPPQVKKLMGAKGRINLSLRRPDDEGGQEEQPEEDVTEYESSPMPQIPSDFFSAPEPQNEFVMEVMEGADVRRYTWDDTTALPDQIGESQAPMPATGASPEVTPDFPFPKPEGFPVPDEEFEEDEEVEEDEPANGGPVGSAGRIS